MNATGDVYMEFLTALNDKNLSDAERCVDQVRYRENCVGFTPGWVDWPGAKESIEVVWKGLPDLRVELDRVVSDDDAAIAHGVVRGTAMGRLYGAPATKRSFEASFFDYVRVADGLIVERVQQTDVLAEMRQLYGRTIGMFGLMAMFLRQRKPDS